MGKEQIMKEMKHCYELAKKVKLENRMQDKEKIESIGNESTIRSAIYHAERNWNELNGMLDLMESAGVISYEEKVEESKNIENLFSSERLYGAWIRSDNGNLVLCVSEIKKED